MLKYKNKCITISINLCYNLLFHITVGLLVLLTSIMEPISRGFFCNDMTIMYPYKPSSVGKSCLCLLYLGLPNILVNIFFI